MNPKLELLATWVDKPNEFVKDVLGLELEPWQIDALDAIASHDLVAFLASKGVGKSFLEAVAGFWWLSTRRLSQVICTSINADNLSKGLWKEIEGLYHRNAFLKEAFEMNSEKVYAKPDGSTPWGREEWAMSRKGWREKADSVEQAQALAGIHGPAMLWLGDEAGSYHKAILASGSAMRANVTPGSGNEAKILLGGNTTDPEGVLGEIRDNKQWKIIRINSDPDNPNRCKRVSIEWARNEIAQRGRDDPYVKVAVLGEFPNVGFNSLLGGEDVEASIRRTYLPEVYERAQKRMGVDVARFGDDSSVIYIRQGLKAGPYIELRKLDTVQLANRVALEASRHGVEIVFVDEVGVGAGVIDNLRRIMKGITVIGVNSSESATDSVKFYNKRAELCWAFADWVKVAKGQVPIADQKLHEEMKQPTYNFKGGRILIEDKQQIKDRIGRSPDNYDALLQTFASPEMPSLAGGVGSSVLQRLAQQRTGRANPGDYDPFAEREVQSKEFKGYADDFPGMR